MMEEGAAKTRQTVVSKHQSKFPWLVLRSNGLGCRLCEESQAAVKKGFAAGAFKPGKYFYSRTLIEHLGILYTRSSLYLRVSYYIRTT